MRPFGKEFSEDLLPVVSILSPFEDTLVPMPWFTDQTYCDISYGTSIKSLKFNLLINLRLFPKEAQNLSGEQRWGSKLPPVDLACPRLVDTHGGG